jgi:23S rRNA pseudouridine955/2504/2580 synthase
MRVASPSDPTAKPAQTRFRRLQAGHGMSYMEAEPLTGRTHQIRVHCAHVGHPIAGDDKYRVAQEMKDREKLLGLNRLCLHASRLVFTEKPDGREIVLESPPDAGWDDLIRGSSTSGEHNS